MPASAQSDFLLRPAPRPRASLAPPQCCQPKGAKGFSGWKRESGGKAAAALGTGRGPLRRTSGKTRYNPSCISRSHDRPFCCSCGVPFIHSYSDTESMMELLKSEQSLAGGFDGVSDCTWMRRVVPRALFHQAMTQIRTKEETEAFDTVTECLDLTADRRTGVIRFGCNGEFS